MRGLKGEGSIPGYTVNFMKYIYGFVTTEEIRIILTVGSNPMI